MSQVVGTVLSVAGRLMVGDVLGAGATVFSSLVPNLIAEKSSPFHDVSASVELTVTNWAAGESLSSALGSGLDLACVAIEKHGLDQQAMEDLNFNSQVIAETVINETARAWRGATSTGFWMPDTDEPEMAVAQRVIEETYRRVVPIIAATPSAISGLLQRAVEHQKHLEGLLAQLVTAQLVPNLADEHVVWAVTSYLRARLADWNEEPQWLHSTGTPDHSMSALQQPLRVVSVNDRPVEYGEAQALDGTHMLVVVGSPGSGKTWLSRRYAISAAQDALDQIELGAGLAQLELPIWTTWDAWTRCDPSHSVPGLIKSSFSGSHGFRELSVEELLVRVLVECEHKLGFLLVVDSLDEDHFGHLGGPLDVLQGLRND